MLQFFDNLPNDRWAALLYVERHARARDLAEPASPEKRRRYMQWVLVAAYELHLRILPAWQSEADLLYRVAGEMSDELFASFERDFAGVLPKIALLAERSEAPRISNAPTLDLAKAT